MHNPDPPLNRQLLRRQAVLKVNHDPPPPHDKGESMTIQEKIRIGLFIGIALFSIISISSPTVKSGPDSNRPDAGAEPVNGAQAAKAGGSA